MERLGEHVEVGFGVVTLVISVAVEETPDSPPDSTVTDYFFACKCQPFHDCRRDGGIDVRHYNVINQDVANLIHRYRDKPRTAEEYSYPAG